MNKPAKPKDFDRTITECSLNAEIDKKERYLENLNTTRMKAVNYFFRNPRTNGSSVFPSGSHFSDTFSFTVFKLFNIELSCNVR